MCFKRAVSGEVPPKVRQGIESSSEGLRSVKSRRQALKFCLDSAVVVVVQIFDQFPFEVFH